MTVGSGKELAQSRYGQIVLKPARCHFMMNGDIYKRL